MRSKHTVWYVHLKCDLCFGCLLFFDLQFLPVVPGVTKVRSCLIPAVRLMNSAASHWVLLRLLHSLITVWKMSQEKGQ